MADEEHFPRDLTPQEREFLTWLLPVDRSGYLAYRQLVDRWRVHGRGRRGEGNYILAAPNELIDNESPLPQLLAYGVVETSAGNIAVSIRERLGNQLEFEIVNMQGESVPRAYRESRRWTLSSWSPGQECPACRGVVREVAMSSQDGQKLVLSICARDRKIWVYDGRSGINHPVPVTNFYNELMLHKNVRDPVVALDSGRFFSDLSSHSDPDLARAFVTYNKLRTKINLDQPIVLPEDRRTSWLGQLSGFFKREKN